jgi:hypothetical protein
VLVPNRFYRLGIRTPIDLQSRAMDEREIRERKQAIEAEFGPWTALNIPLGYGINTNPKRMTNLLLRRATQTIADLSTKPWSQLRILDLGSLEGAYSLEFASHGAQVVGIEGRESSNVHARFAAEALGLSNVEFFTDDVRNLSQEKYGRFDVVYCSGLLYHLPGVDACEFLSAIAQICQRLTIIDTQVGLTDQSSINWRGRIYRGYLSPEHSADDTPEVKATRKWSSLDNNTSFWFTKPSLLNLLRDVGFTGVFEVYNPNSDRDFCDNLTFAALIGGPRQCVNIAPHIAQIPEPDWPEHSNLPRHPCQIQLPQRQRPLWRRIAGPLLRRMRPKPR